MRNPLKGWQVDRAAIRCIGRDLQRPECILAERDGTLWSADARGGVMRIAPDGSQRLIAQQVDMRFTSAAGTAESFSLQGTLYRDIDGVPLGKTNFILRDSQDRIWLTVTTRAQPWTRSIYEKLPDGYVGLIDARGVRIVADGFVGTNECRHGTRDLRARRAQGHSRRSCLRRARQPMDDVCALGPDRGADAGRRA